MMSLRERIMKNQLLREHMAFNFYPPIREEVAESVMKYFTAYWNGSITFDQLCEASPIPREELIERFDFFINVEDTNQE